MRSLKFLAFVFSASVLFVGSTSGHMGATGVAKERMALMKSMGTAMKTIGRMARGETKLDAVQATEASRTIARHGPRIVSLFPAGSGRGVSEASPEIWRDPEGFRKHADALVAASQRLHAVTTSNDLAAIRSAYREVGKTCIACHKRFRVKKQR